MENKENKLPKSTKVLCVVCFQEDDSHLKGDKVSWVQCDSNECEAWVHLKCIPKRIVDMIHQGNSFYCPTCQWMSE